MRAAIVLLFLLAGCVAGNVRQPARLDLGPVALSWQPADAMVRSVEVHAPSWLSGTALQYRLLYADPHGRLAYAESRWAAPPAELIGQALNRQPGPAAGGCRLKIELDELIQVFDSPRTSRALIEVRAALFPPRGETPVARKTFAVSQPDAGADARSGVAALSAAMQRLGGELGAWMAPLSARCRGGGDR